MKPLAVTLMVLCPGGYIARVPALVRSLEGGKNPLGEQNISIVILSYELLVGIMDIQVTTYNPRSLN